MRARLKTSKTNLTGKQRKPHTPPEPPTWQRKMALPIEFNLELPPSFAFTRADTPVNRVDYSFNVARRVGVGCNALFGEASMPTTAAVIPMKWANGRRHDDIVRCVCCDRPIVGKYKLVEVIDGGLSVAAPGLGPDESEPGYMGFFPVGLSCARKHFQGFTHDS